MTLLVQKRFAAHVFRLLKVNEIILPIGRTNRGNLGLRFSTQNDDYEMYLDAVPLSTSNPLEDENNIQLKAVIEKYYFEPLMASPPTVHTTPLAPANAPETPKKKGGRPLGSKNHAKTTNKETEGVR